MTTFILGMLTMYIICVLIAIIAEAINASDEIKFIARGGSFWYPLVLLIRWIDTMNFKKEMKKILDKQNQKYSKKQAGFRF